MYSNKELTIQKLKNFNFVETKRNVKRYFENLEKLKWELAKINAYKGLTAHYDFTVEYKRLPYIPFGKDEFDLSEKECKEEELKKYISSYYWAKSILSDNEQFYINEHFLNDKYENELAEQLGFSGSDNHAYRRLIRSAVYKFADFLGLVERDIKNGKKKTNK